jgi:hypothetical protein
MDNAALRGDAISIVRHAGARLALKASQSRVGIVDEAAAVCALREWRKTDPLQSDDERWLRASTLDQALAT